MRCLCAGCCAAVFAGVVAWKLYDTYGFPVDLTRLMAEERNMSIDMEGFQAAKKLAQVRTGGPCWVGIMVGRCYFAAENYSCTHVFTSQFRLW